MEELLNDIDELLAKLEDFTHGEDGMEITRMRGRIANELNSYNSDNTKKYCPSCKHEVSTLQINCSNCDTHLMPD